MISDYGYFRLNIHANREFDGDEKITCTLLLSVKHISYKYLNERLRWKALTAETVVVAF